MLICPPVYEDIKKNTIFTSQVYQEIRILFNYNFFEKLRHMFFTLTGKFLGQISISKTFIVSAKLVGLSISQKTILPTSN